MTKSEQKPRQFTITENDLANWQREFQELQLKQATIQQELNNVHQNIMFAQRYFNQQLIKEGAILPQQQTMQTIVFPMMPHNIQNSSPRAPAPQAAPKLPDIIMGFFATGAEKMTKQEIKKAIKDTGFNKLGTNDAYFYTTIKRLVDKGLLMRNGDFYSRKVL